MKQFNFLNSKANRLKKLVSFSLFAFIVFCIITSCNTISKQKIAQIDTLLVVLKKAESNFKLVDTTNIKSRREAIEKKIAFIQQSYTDTLTKQQALQLDKYNSIRKSYEKLKQYYPELLQEISYSETQLLTLKKDVEENNIAAESIDGYISKENNAAEKTMESIRIYLTAIKKYNTQHDSIQTAIDSLFNLSDNAK